MRENVGSESVGVEINHHLIVCDVLRDCGVPEEEAYEIAIAHPVSSFVKLVTKKCDLPKGGESGRLRRLRKLREQVEEKLILRLQELPAGNLKAPGGMVFPKLDHGKFVRRVVPEIVGQITSALTGPTKLSDDQDFF